MRLRLKNAGENSPERAQLDRRCHFEPTGFFQKAPAPKRKLLRESHGIVRVRGTLWRGFWDEFQGGDGQRF